jgi:serine phosphatase RsbU (regulator of sigma subunit)
MASTPRHPEHGGASTEGRDAAEVRDPLPDSRLTRAVVAAAARGPSARPVVVFAAAVAVEAVFLVALGAVQQTRHILGIPGSLMALTAVVAGASGGPLVGSLVALVGAVIYYGTVASFGARGALPPTLISTAIWVAAALISAFLSDALREQARRRREAAAALAEAHAARRAQEEVGRLHEALELQLVPPARIESPDLEVIVRSLPSEGRLRLGGDFLDVMSLPRGGLALVVGDVSGHGPTAAALGATLRATWQGLVMGGADRATIRATLDATMIRERRDEDAFATACLAWIDRAGEWDRLHILNIAHPAPLLIGEEVTPIAAPPSLPMGVGGEVRWEPVIVTLTPPWALVFYTDGLVEGLAAPDSPKRFGEAGLVSRLSGLGLPDELAVDALLAHVKAANGGPMSDDIALVVVSRRA